MFVTNWISTTKIQKISEITNFFRHYFLSRTEVLYNSFSLQNLVILKKIHYLCINIYAYLPTKANKQNVKNR